ncbi:MAG: DciA family protein [Candidimonas sp.]
MRNTVKTAAMPRADLAIQWLSSTGPSADVLATARYLLDLERATRQALPAGLAQACKAARVDGQQMTLAVPSPAHAAKLRQLAPSVAAKLSEQGWNISEVSVKVQARLAENRTKPLQSGNTQPLDAAALHAFDELSSRLRPGPLADAVRRLLSHHKS